MSQTLIDLINLFANDIYIWFALVITIVGIKFIFTEEHEEE